MTFPYTQHNVLMPTIHQDREGSLQHGSLKTSLKQGLPNEGLLLIIKEMDAIANIIVLVISSPGPGCEHDGFPQQTRGKPLRLTFPHQNFTICVSFIHLAPLTAMIVFSCFTYASAKKKKTNSVNREKP